MMITNVKIILKESGRLKGIAEVVLNNSIAIHNLRIIEGNKGLFVAFPSNKKENGEYYDICHPINKEIRNIFETTIINSYKEALNVQNNN